MHRAYIGLELMKQKKLISILEAILFSHSQVMSLERIASAFTEEERPDKEMLRAALEDLAQEYRDRAVELVEVAGGFRFQTCEAFAPWIQGLLTEKPTRYSRATLETLALIIYRQPITRAEIEEIRGVAVSSSIIKTLEERGWIRVVGHREVPGRPALLATTRQFLDDFNLKRLSDLPSLDAILAMEEVEAKIAQQLELLPADKDSAVTEVSQVGDVAVMSAAQGSAGINASQAEHNQATPVDHDSSQTTMDHTNIELSNGDKAEAIESKADGVELTPEALTSHEQVTTTVGKAVIENPYEHDNNE